MVTRESNNGFEITGRIDTKLHDVESLRSAVDDYDSLSDKEKLELTRSVNPEYEDNVYNVTTDRLHQYFVDNLDLGQTGSKDNIGVDFLGLGTAGENGSISSNTDLNNRVYSNSVTDIADNGKELLASTFISSSSANGFELDELGLFSGDPANLANADVFLMNHATFSAVTKDSSKTITFDVTLTFSDV